MNTHFIVIGYYGWGKGSTKANALREMRKNVDAKHKKSYVLFSVPKDAYVTHFGSIVATIEPIELERVGMPK